MINKRGSVFVRNRIVFMLISMVFLRPFPVFVHLRVVVAQSFEPFLSQRNYQVKETLKPAINFFGYSKSKRITCPNHSK